MQLTKIKLSGFKSFVEKTEIHLSKRRTGIVGPNGCGKSNIIDAVRWVLGESRATELRGESLQDVIFSGSSSRHKAGRASVELFFDNPDKKISGPWGEFTEISVKKTVTSDGQSSSFINDTNVRRKDILDLFLGTGLGPKSYAIIGQGMIGRIVDAKPEELRVFLEEASGISKYRQRRKETESRLSDGRESMERVSDLILELEERTNSLESQAKKAAIFQDKNDSKKNLKLFLLWKKKQSLDSAVLSCQKELDNEKFECDKMLAVIKTIELELTSSRNNASTSQKKLDEDNQKYYEINNEITKQENENRLINEKILHAKEILNNALLVTKNIESSIDTENKNLEDHDEKLKRSGNVISEKTLHLDGFKSRIAPLEKSLDDTQITYTEARAEFAVLESEKLNFELRHKNLLDTKDNQDKKTNELISALDSMDTVSTNQIDEQNKFSDIKIFEAQKAKDSVGIRQNEKEQSELEFEEINVEYSKIDKETLSLSAEYAGLVSIQKKMLDLDSLDNWLENNKLSFLPSLVSLLKVNANWEVAVESILKNKLGALHIPSIAELSKMDNTNPPASVSFFSTQSCEYKNEPPSIIDGFKNLSFAIESDNEASQIAREILKNYFCIENIDEAVKNQEKLNFHSRFVTKEGNVIGKSDLFLHSESSSSSLLNREEKIDTLKTEISNYEYKKNTILLRLEKAKIKLDLSKKELDRARENATVCIQESHEAELKLVVLREKSDSISQKNESLKKDLISLKLDLSKTQSEILSSQENQSQNKVDIASSGIRLEKLDRDLQISTQELSLINEEFKEYEESLQFLKLDQRSVIESRASILKRIDEFEVTKIKSTSDKNDSFTEINKLESLLISNIMNELLDKQKIIEEDLKTSRNLLEVKNSEIRIHDEKRITLEKEVNPLREKISKFEIENSRLHGVKQELHEQFITSGLDKKDIQNQLLARSKSYVNLSSIDIERQINKLTKQIDDLGMVNLAALAELNEVIERKNNFVTQLNDLQKAEMELSEAIKRMDIETKDLLKKTFHEVNENLKIFFAGLFGGGHSKLIFLEDDILNSGINLMAQPPGKKITSIQQLSGGEKSLTAIALVFSFFKLNPAPFCILDEADAALDEANTLGLNKLLNDLSDITQFIFITHNKTLMETAEQLIGITMQELGVSRAVTVDIESAESMVEEAA